MLYLGKLMELEKAAAPWGGVYNFGENGVRFGKGKSGDGDMSMFPSKAEYDAFRGELQLFIDGVQKDLSDDIISAIPTTVSTGDGCCPERALEVTYGSASKVIPWRELSSYRVNPFGGFYGMYSPYSQGETAWIDSMSELELVHFELSSGGFYPAVEMPYTSPKGNSCVYYMYVHPTGAVVFLEEVNGALRVCRYIIASDSENGINANAVAALQQGGEVDIEDRNGIVVAVLGNYVVHRGREESYTMDLIRQAHLLDSADWTKHQNSTKFDSDGNESPVCAAGVSLFVKHSGITYREELDGLLYNVCSQLVECVDEKDVEQIRSLINVKGGNEYMESVIMSAVYKVLLTQSGYSANTDGYKAFLKLFDINYVYLCEMLGVNKVAIQEFRFKLESIVGQAFQRKELR